MSFTDAVVSAVARRLRDIDAQTFADASDHPQAHHYINVRARERRELLEAFQSRRPAYRALLAHLSKFDKTRYRDLLPTHKLKPANIEDLAACFKSKVTSPAEAARVCLAVYKAMLRYTHTQLNNQITFSRSDLSIGMNRIVITWPSDPAWRKTWKQAQPIIQEIVYDREALQTKLLSAVLERNPIVTTVSGTPFTVDSFCNALATNVYRAGLFYPGTFDGTDMMK